MTTIPKPKSEAEELLAFQMKATGIEFIREFPFAMPRRWRADFLVDGPIGSPCYLIEVEGGHFSGGHKRGAAADTDTEKHNAAVIAGYRVLRFTPAQVTSGAALATIERALK